MDKGVGISNKPVTKLVPSRKKQDAAHTKNSETKRHSFSRYIKVGIVSFVLVGVAGSQLIGRVSGSNQYVAPQARLENPIQVPQSQPVDEVIAADVAAAVAQEADLLVTPNVANRADTLNAQVNTATAVEATDTAVIEKPQLVAPSVKSINDMVTIDVQAGDSVASLAQKYSISEDTIRWANDLRTDTISPGGKLVILPVTGVLHTVQANDTAETLATTYQASAEQITAFNDLEVQELKPGVQLIIPGGVKPAPRSTARATATPRSASFSWGGGSVVFAGNRYAYGYCTYYAFNRRAELGRPIGSNWGNATTWASLAAASGFRVDKTPAVGAIIQNTGGWGGYGHVGVVERVNPDGSILVSDMNYAGWNRISTRTVSASQVGIYSYIH